MTEVVVSTVTLDDGIKLHTKVFDEDPSRPKPLLIALHGAPGLFTSAEPAASFRQFASLFKVLVFDGRGSGASDIVGPYTHERWMKDIDFLRDWAGAKTFVLAGHSYGGFLALDYAVNYPQRLQGLVLIDTWTNGSLGSMNVLANILTDDRVKVDKARQVRVWSGNLLNDEDYKTAIAEILPIYAPPAEVQREVAPDGTLDETSSAEFFGPGGVFHSETQNFAFGYNMPRFDVRDRLNRIKCPTLVAVGRHDIVTPVSFSENIVEGVQDAQLVIFERSGHSPQSDEPGRFRDVLLSFFKHSILRTSVHGIDSPGDRSLTRVG